MGQNIGDESYVFEGEIEVTTNKAILVNLTNGDQLWIPKSQIIEQRETRHEKLYEFVITEWFAKKNKL